MKSIRSAVLAGFALASASATAAAQGVDMAVFRMKQDSVTVVLGALEVQRPVGGTSVCPYQVTMRVTDERGAALLNEQWREDRGCVGSLPRSVKTYEAIRFATRPGRYEIAVAMNPEGNAPAAKRTSLTVETLPANARASDLVLARDIGVVDTTNTARWTVRHNGIGIAAEPGAHIAAEQPRLFYYLEVYGKAGEPLTGTLTGSVVDAQGTSLAELQLATINGKGPMTRLAASAVVAGLPAGTYTLNATVKLADTTFTRSSSFIMDAPVVVASAGNATYFQNLSKEEIASQFDPLVVWLDTKQERDLFTSLDEAGKRQFLIRYFGPNGPTGDPQNKLDMYLERVKQVNENYGERTGRQSRPAWRTDRGRIMLLRGQPNNQLKRPFPTNEVKPYEIWAYNVGNQYVYVFQDDTRLGQYRLVFTTDPREVSLPDWENRLGPAVIEELRTTFGVRTQ